MQLKFSNTESILVYLFQTINNFIMSKAVQYAVGLAGLALTIYVVGVAWKASRTSTLGDKVVGAVEGAVSTANVTTGETSGASSADVTAQEESNFAGKSYSFMGTPVM